MPRFHRNPSPNPTSPLIVWALLLSACWIRASEMDVDGDGYRVGEDCDDGDPLVHPGVEETCDGKDNDCDGGTDDDGVCPADCGMGIWGDLAVDADTVYVVQAADPGGDGSEDRPFASIQQGLDAAGESGGGMVAVAGGIYTETLVFTANHTGVHLAGRCRDMVILDASVGDEEIAGIDLDLRDGAVVMSGLTVRGSRGPGIHVSSGAVTIRTLEMDENATAGLWVSGAGSYVALQDTLIQGTVPSRDGSTGYGIIIEEGSTLKAERCTMDANMGAGIAANNPGTIVTLLETTVRDTQPDANGVYGRGIDIENGASMVAESCTLEANAGVGVYASHPDTTIILVDTSVRNTLPGMDGEGGSGIRLFEGATLYAEVCDVDANTGAGILLADDAVARLLDSNVRNTKPDESGSSGIGVGVSGGATLEAEACIFETNTAVGVRASDPGTTATLRGTTVRDTIPGSAVDSSCAVGVSVQDGAFIDASDLMVTSNEGPGIVVYGDGAMMECVGCSLEDNQFAGAAALSGGKLAMTDATIKGTTANSQLLGGVGVYAWPWDGDPPIVILTNSVIEENPVAGVWLIGNGSYVITGNSISGGIGEPFGGRYRCGDAVLALEGVTAWDGKSGLLLQNNLLQNASGAGLFLDASSALLSDNVYYRNTVDLVVQNQSCDSIPDCYLEAPLRDLCPVYANPTCYAEFFFEATPADPKDL